MTTQNVATMLQAIAESDNIENTAKNHTKHKGVFEVHTDVDGTYAYLFYRGSDLTNYILDGMTINRSSPALLLNNRTLFKRHRLDEDLSRWLKDHLNGQFSLRPGWSAPTLYPIRVTFLNHRAAMAFKMHWL